MSPQFYECANVAILDRAQLQVRGPVTLPRCACGVVEGVIDPHWVGQNGRMDAEVQVGQNGFLADAQENQDSQCNEDCKGEPRENHRREAHAAPLAIHPVDIL